MSKLSQTMTAVVAILLLSGGCGYSVSSTLDDKYQTIHVPAFKNQSREFDLQAPLTNAIIRKFLTDGRLRVVGPGEADLIVDGSILGYTLAGLSFDRQDELTQFQTFISARVKVTDTRTGDVLWQESRMIGETSFATSIVGSSSDRLRGNTGTFLSTVRSFATAEENRAASEALERLAADIFFRTIEPW